MYISVCICFTENEEDDLEKMTYWEDKESYIYVYQRMYMFYYWEDVK